MSLKSTYTATASYQDKTESTSPALSVHQKDRINLHFLRYGLLKDPQAFDDENMVLHYIESSAESKQITYSGGAISESPVLRPYSKEYKTSIKFDNKLNNCNKTPQVKNFKSAPMILNVGYLYIIDETENQHYEYQVLEDYQGFIPILWTEDNLKDIREPSKGAKVISYIDVKKGNTINVAYSPVQWTQKYMEQMLNNEGGMRDTRMKKVKCIGITQSNNQECTKNGIFNVLSIKPYFYSRDTASGTNTPTSSCYRMAEIVSTVIALEVAEQLKLGNNNVFEDMFIVLDDAAGCASDICGAIYEKQYALRELIQSSMRGDGSNDENMWLMNHAISFYQLFYHPEHTSLTEIQKLRSNVVDDENFYKKLLAVDERKKIRDRLDDLRADLLSIMNSDFYSNSIYNFEQAENDMLLDGGGKILDHHNALKANPADSDKHLDITSQISLLNQKINTYMQKICDDQEHIVSKLFAKPIDLDDIANADLFWFNFQGLASLTAPYVENIEMFIKHKWFNGKILWRSKAIDGIKEHFWVVEKDTLANILNRMQVTNEVRTTGGFGKGTKGMTGIKISNINAQLEKCIRLNIKIDPERGIFKMNKPLEKIFYCKSFLMLGGMLSALNLMGTIGKFGKQKGNFELAKSVTSTVGVTTEIAWFMTKYAERHVTRTTDLARKTMSANNLIGKANVGISVVVSLFDSVNAFRGRDHDAGVAYIGAAVCYGVSLFFMTKVGISSLGGLSVATGIGVGTLASALSIIALIVAVVLIFVVLIYLQDTPFEQYLKNCILSSKATKKIEEWQAMTQNQLINAIVGAKKRIVSAKFDEWYDLKKSFEELILLTSACKMNPEYTRTKYTYDLADRSLKALSIENYMPNLRINSEIQGGFMLVFKSASPPTETTCRFICFEDLVKAGDVVVEMSDKCVKVYFNNLYSHIEKEVNSREEELNKEFKVQRGHPSGREWKEKAEVLYKVYLYQRIFNQQDGELFPYSDCYLINAFETYQARLVAMPIILDDFLKSTFNYNDYCNRRDKTILTLNELQKLVCSRV